MALNDVSLCAGDQGNRAASRPARGDLSPSASAWAMVSGDSALVAGPGGAHPGPPPRQAARPGARAESRRAAGGGWSPARSGKGRDPGARSRSRQGRFAPYPARGPKLDLRRSVLQRRLAAGARPWPPASPPAPLSL